MEDEMDKLMRQLRDARPSPSDPQGLTDSIMDRIQQCQSAKPVQPRPTPWMLVARTVLSSAAALLFGLFLFQHLEAQESNTTAWKPSVSERIELDPNCIQGLEDGSGSVVESYLCHIRQHSIQNKTFKTYPNPKN